jgi:predicted transposase/invertase (TIGR01784 family)
MTSKFINPYTDFGFKKLFGEEASKPILIDFLSCLLPEADIVDLTFKDKENLGKAAEDRKAIFDIYCEDSYGEKIIVEMQKAKQNYFKDRMVFYATFPIQEQANGDNWNYELKAVYCVGILDFVFSDNKNKAVIQSIQLKNQKNQVFYDKLKFVYLEMPNFKKQENELVTRLDKWLYFIKHLADFTVIPTIFSDEIFIKAFNTAEIASYSIKERETYEDSVKMYRDIKNVVDTGRDEGRNEGIEIGIDKGKLIQLYNTIDECINENMDIKQIAKINKVSEDFINNYLANK